MRFKPKSQCTDKSQSFCRDVVMFSSQWKISFGFSSAKSVNKGTTCLAVTAGSSPLPSYYWIQSKCETKLPPPLSATETSHSELVSRAKIPMLGVIVCLRVCLVFPQIYNRMTDHWEVLGQEMGFCPNHSLLLSLINLFTGTKKKKLK